MIRKRGPKLNKDNGDSVSLNKYISDSGFCSRREADDYIAKGRVTINSRPAALGNRVTSADSVEIDGEPMKKKVKPVYIAFNKPLGIACSTDEKEKNNIIDYIGYPERIFPIGRLDKDSEGLIFLTNDGNIVNKMLRAGNNHDKEYVVVVDKPIDRDFIEHMSSGVTMLGTRTKRCKVTQEAKSVFRIVLTQGMNRQIRRMCAVLDYKVVRLKRVRIMNIHLANLASGVWRHLTPEELVLINKLMTDSSNTEEASIIIQEEEEEVAPRGMIREVKDGREARPARGERTSSRPTRDEKTAIRDVREGKPATRTTTREGKPPARDTRDLRDPRDTRAPKPTRKAADPRDGKHVAASKQKSPKEPKDKDRRGAGNKPSKASFKDYRVKAKKGKG